MARPDNPNPYTKLAGRGLRRTGFGVSATRARLWLGEDHLLAVDYTVAAEEYRRFYFRDIEAVIIRRTANRLVWNWILGVLAVLNTAPLLAAYRSQGSGGYAVAALGCAAFWLVLLIINTVRGTSCQTHIRTAAQLEQLPSLNRLPVARKALARLQPLILAAQGQATPEELAAAPWMSPENAPRSGIAPSPPVRADNGLLHGILFLLLLVEAIATGIYFAWHQPLSVIGLLAMLVGCIVCVAALVRQGHSDLPAAVRTAAKCAIGYYVLKSIVGFVFMMIYTIRSDGAPIETGLEIMHMAGFAMTSAISGGIAALLGILGLAAVLAHRRSRPAAAAA